MNTQTRRQIIAEISQYTRLPRLQDDEFTVAQYAEFHQITYSAASAELRRALEEGTLTRRQVKHDHRRRWAYKYPNPDPANPNQQGESHD